MKPRDIHRFERCIYKPLNKEECWLWLGTIRNGFGYGVFSLNGKNEPAHRVSYELYKGPIPDGMFVLHNCDNRVCMNPAHLRLGTQQANMKDKVTRGRSARGEQNGIAKLTEKEVLEIRRLYAKGVYTHAALAELFKVSPKTVFKILKRLTWKHI